MSKRNRRPQRYSYTSLQKRIQLIRLIKQQGFKLLHAASILHINYSTAKMIMLKFRNTGQITSFNHEIHQTHSQHEKNQGKQSISSNVSQQNQNLPMSYDQNKEFFPNWNNTYWGESCYFFLPLYLPINPQICVQNNFFSFQ